MIAIIDSGTPTLPNLPPMRNLDILFGNRALDILFGNRALVGDDHSARGARRVCRVGGGAYTLLGSATPRTRTGASPAEWVFPIFRLKDNGGGSILRRFPSRQRGDGRYPH